MPDVDPSVKGGCKEALRPAPTAQYARPDRNRSAQVNVLRRRETWLPPSWHSSWSLRSHRARLQPRGAASSSREAEVTVKTDYTDPQVKLKLARESLFMIATAGHEVKQQVAGAPQDYHPAPT